MVSIPLQDVLFCSVCLRVVPCVHLVLGVAGHLSLQHVFLSVVRCLSLGCRSFETRVVSTCYRAGAIVL